MQFLFADHVLDTDRRELHRGSTQIAVEPQVFDLLTYLVQKGRTAMAGRSDGGKTGDTTGREDF